MDREDFTPIGRALDRRPPNDPIDLGTRIPLLADYNDHTEKAPQDLAKVLSPFARHWRIFAGVFVGTILVVVLLTQLVPKTYTTTAKLMAGTSSQPTTSVTSETLPLLNALITMPGTQSAETYTDLMQGTSLADRVAERLRLPIRGSDLLDRVTVKPVTNTAIVSVSVRWSDALGSARIANEFGDQFVREQRNFLQRQADEAISFLKAELPDARRRMASAERAESDFERRNGLVDVGTQTQSLLQRAAALDAKIGDARLAARQSAASLARVRSTLLSIPAVATKDRNTVPDPGRAQLVLQRDQIALQLQSAEQQYTAEHPSVIALRSQLQRISAEIARKPQQTVGYVTTGANPLHEQLAQESVTLQTAEQSERAQLLELDKQRRAIVPEIARLPEQTRTIVALRRSSKETNDVYSRLNAKLSEAMLERTTIPSSVAVVEKARATAAVVTPSYRANLLSGVVLALALALTAVFFANMLDRTLKSEADVERELALPVLTRVPRLGRTTKVSDSQQAVNAEAFLQLFWSARYSSETPIRSIAVVSANPGEGKSTVALNGAIALAQTHPGVLIIDADLRRPTLHTALGLPRAAGLSDVLNGSESLDVAVQSTAHSGLFLLAAGSANVNSTRLLQSTRYLHVIDELRKRFAMIVVDTPALNVVYDGVAACTATDATVFVVASASTDVDLARRALRRLHSLKHRIIGVVLNRASIRRDNDYSSYFEREPTQTVLPSISSSV
ncbi:MAG: exopolysaccharide regulatory tyrosine autokinase VpsO [Vulcanimicrobiaceae bacterium]